MLIGLCVQLLGSRLEMSSFSALFVLFVATNVVVVASALVCYVCNPCPEPWNEKYRSVSNCTSAIDPHEGNGDDVWPDSGLNGDDAGPDSDSHDSPHFSVPTFPSEIDWRGGKRGKSTDDIVCSKFVGKYTEQSKTTSGMVCFCTSM